MDNSEEKPVVADETTLTPPVEETPATPAAEEAPSPAAVAEAAPDDAAAAPAETENEGEEQAVTFDIFPLCDELRQGIAEAGFREPTPI